MPCITEMSIPLSTSLPTYIKTTDRNEKKKLKKRCMPSLANTHPIQNKMGEGKYIGGFDLRKAVGRQRGQYFN